MDILFTPAQIKDGSILLHNPPPYNRRRARQSNRDLNSCSIPRFRTVRRRQQGPSPPPSDRPLERILLCRRLLGIAIPDTSTTTRRKLSVVAIYIDFVYLDFVYLKW